MPVPRDHYNSYETGADWRPQGVGDDAVSVTVSTEYLLKRKGFKHKVKNTPKNVDDLLRARWIILISENETAINSTRDHFKVTLNPLATKAEQVISLYGNIAGPKLKVITVDIITIQKSS